MKNPEVLEPAFDGKHLAIGYPGVAPFTRAVVWDTEKWSVLGEYELAKSAFILAMAFSRDGAYLALGGVCYHTEEQDDDSAYFDVRVFNISSKKCVATLKGNDSRVRCIAFSPDANLLVCGCQDGSVRIWDISNIMIDMNKK